MYQTANVAQPGRGAVQNVANRYHACRREAFDDGWRREAEAPFKTQLGVDRSRKIISKNDSPDVLFDHSINPYRGCEHGCIYCYARPTHAWLDLSPGLDFESRLFHKPEAVELLRDELARPGYQPKLLALSGVTDPYQPIERRLRLTRGIVELLTESRHPFQIITKSGLIQRDIDLLAEAAAHGTVEVAISVTTLSRNLSRRLEPRAMGPTQRLETIAALSEAGVPVKVMIGPVIPVLTDSELENILAAARSVGASAAGYILLRLPLEVSPLFRDWLETHYPDKAAHVMSQVQACRGGRDNQSGFGQRMVGEGMVAELIAQRFRLATRRLGFAASPALRGDLFRRPQPSRGQLALF